MRTDMETLMAEAKVRKASAAYLAALVEKSPQFDDRKKQ